MSSADDVPEPDGDPTPVASFAVQPDIAALYDRYADVMWASATKVLGPNSMTSDAGDAVSTVMQRLQAARSRGQLSDKDNWEPYLRWSARNAALAIVRNRTKTDSLDAAMDNDDRIDKLHDRTEGIDPVTEQAIQRIEEHGVRAAIASAGFTERQMYVLYGFFVEGMTHEQIGQRLGITGQAVGKMRRRAQNRLKELLEGR